MTCAIFRCRFVRLQTERIYDRCAKENNSGLEDGQLKSHSLCFSSFIPSRRAPSAYLTERRDPSNYSSTSTRTKAIDYTAVINIYQNCFYFLCLSLQVLSLFRRLSTPSPRLRFPSFQGFPLFVLSSHRPRESASTSAQLIG